MISNKAESADDTGAVLEFFEFSDFVYDYYNPPVKGLGYGAAIGANTLILENSNTEEEAFDKYFELQEAFRKYKNSPEYVNPMSKIIFQSDVDSVISEHFAKNATGETPLNLPHNVAGTGL